MAYFTLREARNAAQETAKMKRRTASLESYAGLLNENVTIQESKTEFDIFLSHSMQDAEVILGIYRILEKKGYSVYVDWLIDKQLDREKVTASTAQTLKNRMNQSNALVYIATSNSSRSKWMPWELGYFDGIKPDQISILPVLEDANSKFDGQEYLGLYPTVQKEYYEHNHEEVIAVIDKNRRWTTLSSLASGQSDWNKFR